MAKKKTVKRKSSHKSRKQSCTTCSAGILGGLPHKKALVVSGAIFGIILAVLLIVTTFTSSAEATPRPERTEGPYHAPIVIEVFMDPSDAHWQTWFDEVYPMLRRDFMNDGKAQVRFYMDSPPGVFSGSDSWRSVVGAECAAQHRKFLPFVQSMVSLQVFDRTGMRNIARYHLGIDDASFTTCLSRSISGQHQATQIAINSDYSYARRKTVVKTLDLPMKPFHIRTLKQSTTSKCNRGTAQPTKDSNAVMWQSTVQWYVTNCGR